jgi:hypothetical protein
MRMGSAPWLTLGIAGTAIVLSACSSTAAKTDSSSSHAPDTATSSAVSNDSSPTGVTTPSATATKVTSPTAAATNTPGGVANRYLTAVKAGDHTGAKGVSCVKDITAAKNNKATTFPFWGPGSDVSGTITSWKIGAATKSTNGAGETEVAVTVYSTEGGQQKTAAVTMPTYSENGTWTICYSLIEETTAG